MVAKHDLRLMKREKCFDLDGKCDARRVMRFFLILILFMTISSRYIDVTHAQERRGYSYLVTKCLADHNFSLRYSTQERRVPMGSRVNVSSGT